MVLYLECVVELSIVHHCLILVITELLDPSSCALLIAIVFSEEGLVEVWVVVG
jgi:hypothetical protein